MPIKNKSVRPRKREQVVPFVGEENFVVPKRGGFGQPDMEDYVMVAGTTSVDAPNTPTTTGTSIDTSTTTTIPITPAGQTGTSTTTTTPTTSPDTTTTTLPPISTTPPPVVSDTPSTAEADCIARGGAYINGECIIRSAPTRYETVDTIPNFPVWDSLDCTTLKTKIAEYNATLSTSRFSATVVDAYNTEIAKGNAIYNAKCNVSTTPPVAIIAPTPVVGGGFGGGGFGGGGGLGEEPIPQEPVIEEPKKSGTRGLLLILGLIGVVYYLTRKN